MKVGKYLVGVVAALSLSAAVPVFASEQSCSQDAIIDKIGDWLATLGKSEMDKQMVLADRCTKRVLRHTKHELEEANEKAGKEIGKALGN